jgi:hypothetical protein
MSYLNSQSNGEMTDESMALLEAVESFGLIEANVVSRIYIIRIRYTPCGSCYDCVPATFFDADFVRRIPARRFEALEGSETAQKARSLLKFKLWNSTELPPLEV